MEYGENPTNTAKNQVSGANQMRRKIANRGEETIPGFNMNFRDKIIKNPHKSSKFNLIFERFSHKKALFTLILTGVWGTQTDYNRRVRAEIYVGSLSWDSAGHFLPGSDYVHA